MPTAKTPNKETTSNYSDINNMSFEKAMQELESIVAQIDKGELPLDKAVEAYSRGTALKQRCDHLLKEAKLKIEELKTE